MVQYLCRIFILCYNVTNTFAPVAVTKTSTKKVFAHIMPWFETPATNSGTWGIHWTMSNQNPNTLQTGNAR